MGAFSIKSGDLVHVRGVVGHHDDKFVRVSNGAGHSIEFSIADVILVEPRPLKVGETVRMRVGSPSDNGQLLYVYCGYGTVSFGGRAMPQIIDLECLERVPGL